MLGRLQDGTLKEVRVSSNGHILVDGIQPSNSIFTLPYDSIYATYPEDTVEIFTSMNDGSIQEIVTVTYTSSAKEEILSVVRQ